MIRPPIRRAAAGDRASLRRGRAGFTTTEFLVAAVSGLLVTGAALALCGAGNRLVASLVTRQAAWSETRASAALWAVEWRGAGYDPTGVAGARVAALGVGVMELSADWNGNGALTPTDPNPNERLAYLLERGAWRRGVNGGPRLVAAWPDTAWFVFRDAEGHVAGAAPDPADVRVAEIHVRLAGIRPGAAAEVRWAAARRNP